MVCTGNAGNGPFLIAKGKDSLLGLGRTCGGHGEVLNRAGSTEGLLFETSGGNVNDTLLCGEAGDGL